MIESEETRGKPVNQGSKPGQTMGTVLLVCRKKEKKDIGGLRARARPMLSPARAMWPASSSKKIRILE